MAYSNIDKPNQYFNTVLYTGNGTTQSITGVGFQPEWTWIKCRSDARNHQAYDVVRGATNQIYPNLTNAEATDATSLTSFDSDGFSLGSATAVNISGQTFVGWNWLAGGTASSNTDGSITSSVSVNTTSGFSIVSFTGTGSAATVGHGLGKEVDCIAIKNRIDGAQWSFYHRSLGGTKYMAFNSTSGAGTASTQWNNTDPDSSVFSVGTSNNTNDSGDGMIAYCFASIKGFSKFGSYTGNGSTDGTFVYTGFKPAFVMWKRTDSAGYDWDMYDTARDTYNVAFKELLANASSAESSSTVLALDILSNGFKLRTSNANGNASGGTYIYMAFAESPLVGSNLVPNNAR